MCKFYHLVFIVIIILTSCTKEGIKSDISFYHWKSYFELSDTEIDYLESLEVKKLYLRYFDVGIENNSIQPLGKIVDKNKNTFPHEIIPTIFITNNTFKRTTNKDLDDLVNKIITLINNTHISISEKEINEVQFDCDWSESTREYYFTFLERIKEKSNWDISVTLRLHQVKYPEKTGVPPADKFVLMCYNTGDVKDENESNSILSIQELEKYAAGLSSYPHEMELALPLFYWGVLFRDNKLIKLIRNINADTFDGNNKFKLEDGKVQVLESTYLNGYYLYKGDRIRLEDVSLETLESTVSIIRKHLRPQGIIFYHLDDIIIKQYDHEALENISNKLYN